MGSLTESQSIPPCVHLLLTRSRQPEGAKEQELALTFRPGYFLCLSLHLSFKTGPACVKKVSHFPRTRILLSSLGILFRCLWEVQLWVSPDCSTCTPPWHCFSVADLQYHF